MHVEEADLQGRKKRIYSFFPLYITGLLAALFLLFSILSLTIFNASRYSQLLTVEEGDFATDIPQITYDQIPMLDTESARRLGDRKMGELAATNNEEQKSLVSQFEVSPDYIQINYNNRPMRVTQLEYADLFKWLTNRKEGLPGYIMIDMVTQETELVRLEAVSYTHLDVYKRQCVDFAGKQVVDVGSGGGFPGVPLQIANPTARFLLLDSRKKRVDFLQDVCQTMGLPARALAGRAEAVSYTHLMSCA